MNELMPYSEVERDRAEQRLALEANKKELLVRRNNGIHVIAYWLMKENVCTIWLLDERTNSSVEFPVPNDEVTEWFNHPFAHPDCNLPKYEQRNNGNE